MSFLDELQGLGGSAVQSGTSGGTKTGIGGAADWLTGKWLDYQRIRHNVDIERAGDDRNIPDRVDVREGVTNTQRGLGGGSAPVALGLSAWQLLGLGAATVLGYGLYKNRKRKG